MDGWMQLLLDAIAGWMQFVDGCNCWMQLMDAIDGWMQLLDGCWMDAIDGWMQLLMDAIDGCN